MRSGFSPCIGRHLCRRALIICAAALVAGPVQAGNAAAEVEIAAPTSAFVRDYLSDRSRAGSLVGSILGGALSAHPAGPMLGGLIGFIIGKQTMFEDEGMNRRQAVALAQRPIVPPVGAGPVAVLSFSAPTAQLPPAELSLSALAAAAPQPAAAPGEHINMVQLAALCAGGLSPELSSRLRAACFYSQSE